MKEQVLITGANGMIAGHFEALYQDKYDIRLCSRRPRRSNEYFWSPREHLIDPLALEGVEHIIHLAGASLFGARWSSAYKQKILESRVDGSRLLHDALKYHNIKLKSFISVSAVGIYGANPSPYIYKEMNSTGTDFAAFVCKEWEKAAHELFADDLCERLVIPRLGIVLCHYGGALPKMLMGRRLGVGMIWGDGEQMLPWVHINDVCRFFDFAIQNPLLNGTYNLVAPEQISYKHMMQKAYRQLGESLKGIRIPNALATLMLGEAAQMLCGGKRIDSHKVREEGFQFRYASLQQALRSIYPAKEGE